MSRIFGYKRPWNQKGRLIIVYKAKECSRFGRKNGKERKILQRIKRMSQSLKEFLENSTESDGYRPYKYSSCAYKKVTSQTKLDSGLSVDRQLSSYRL